ncbi:hypothetical protein BX600DRAFT_388445 [Xylariales sp. PMI_506]|nr:hypothetical protein BX600DRAFT_388445 [Xylariales sp. PMI_506]
MAAYPKDIRAATAALARSQPLVIVIFGSTSTIGRYSLRVLATASANTAGSKGFRAYLVGRNPKSTEPIIAECRTIYPEGKYTFVQASDLSLLQDVDAACAEVMRREQEESEKPRVDYLLLCQGGAIFRPRKDTKEGIDVIMSLMYYSRMRAITQLLPLLLASNLPAAVSSVFAAGTEAKLFPDDLSLRAPGRYTYLQARSHIVYMHTLFMETLAAEHPGKLRFVHIFPGLIPGPGFNDPELSAWIRIITNYIVLPLFGRWIVTPPDEIGNRIMSLTSAHYPPRQGKGGPEQGEAAVGTDGKPGSGVYALGSGGKNALKVKYYEQFDKDAMRRKVWEHTNKAFEVIASGQAFTE